MPDLPPVLERRTCPGAAITLRSLVLSCLSGCLCLCLVSSLSLLSPQPAKKGQKGPRPKKHASPADPPASSSIIVLSLVLLIHFLNVHPAPSPSPPRQPGPAFLAASCQSTLDPLVCAEPEVHIYPRPLSGWLCAIPSSSFSSVPSHRSPASPHFSSPHLTCAHLHTIIEAVPRSLS